jgi:hypothetical protein
MHNGVGNLVNTINMKVDGLKSMTNIMLGIFRMVMRKDIEYYNGRESLIVDIFMFGMVLAGYISGKTLGHGIVVGVVGTMNFICIRKKESNCSLFYF